jgi:hypothetical protein
MVSTQATTIASTTMSATVATKAAASMSDISHTLRVAGVHAIIEEPYENGASRRAWQWKKGQFLLLTLSFCRCESAARASIFPRLSTSLRTG